MAHIRWKAMCCTNMFLLRVCGLLAAFIIAVGAHGSTGQHEDIVLPGDIQDLFKRGMVPRSELTNEQRDGRRLNKRAVSPDTALQALQVGGDLAVKTAEQLFNKIGEAGDRAAGYLENGASVDVKPQNGFVSDDLFAPPAWEVDIKTDSVDDSEEASESLYNYPMGLGAIMWNGCYGSNYGPGDPCYEARVPSRDTCVDLLDSARFIGVGFDGRGTYSPESTKMSIIQRRCGGLSTYDGFDVPDTMNVYGVYETKSQMVTFEDRNEYTRYLEREAGISGSLFFASAGVTAAYGGAQTVNEQKLMSMMDIDVVRYEVFKEVTTASDLSTDFIQEFMSLPTVYHAPGHPIKFQDFIQRWGTHYIDSGIFGGRLEIKKVSSASFYSSVESFAIQAKYDFDSFFASVHGKFEQNNGSTEAKQTSYSTVSIEAFGGDQEIAAALTDAGSPTIKTDLVNWLDSIPKYPKAIKFGLAPITSLLYFSVEDIFPNKDFTDCNDFGKNKLKIDEDGNKYYYIEKIIANVTVKEKQYCNYDTREQFMEDIKSRRDSLDRAISVYMSEGLVAEDEISVPGGSNYCELSDDDSGRTSDNAPPSWEDITSGQSFTVIFDMEADIEGGYAGRVIPKDDIVTMHYYVNKWFVEKPDGTARLGDGFGNGGSDNIANFKISVDGLVLTFIPSGGLFIMTEEDYAASLSVWPDLSMGLKNLYLARVEWPIALETTNAEEKNFMNSVVKTFPCDVKWSNVQTFDVSYVARHAFQTTSTRSISARSTGDTYLATGTATQISNLRDSSGAEKAIDGNKDPNFSSGSCAYTGSAVDPWWQLDMGSEKIVHTVVITNRGDCCSERIDYAQIHVGDNAVDGSNPQCGMFLGHDSAELQAITITRQCDPPLRGQYVTVFRKYITGYLGLCEVEVFVTDPDVMYIATGTATQSSDLSGTSGAEKAIDGTKDSHYPNQSCSHTANEYKPWWKLDMGDTKIVHKVIITNRGDCCGDRIVGSEIQVGDNAEAGSNTRCGTFIGSLDITSDATITRPCSQPLRGRYVTIQQSVTGFIALCEVEVYVTDPVAGTTAAPTTAAPTTVAPTTVAPTTFLPTTQGPIQGPLPTYSGLCLFFSAVSEGSIYVAFASVPKDKKTWYFVEISPSVASIHKFNHILTETSYINARGLGDGVLQQNYFICIGITTEGVSTLIEYGKYTDEDKRIIYLSYIDKHSPISPMFYGFGSGSKDVTIFQPRIHTRKAPSSISACGPGTSFDPEVSVCVLNCDVNCHPDYGCMISESGQSSPRLCNECRGSRRNLGRVFECAEACPIATINVGGNEVCPCKWVISGGERTCHARCPFGMHADPETSICLDGCPDPGQVENAIRIGDDFSVGSHVYYKCKYSYLLVGEEELYCFDGSWSSSLPRCTYITVEPGLSDWQEFDGSLYYIDYQEAYSYLEASQQCLGRDGYLVSILGAAEGNYVKGFGQNIANLWIGLNDRNAEGQFVWADSTTYSTSAWSDWSSGNPSYDNPGENCVVISRNGGTWNDIYCGNRFGYICEKDIDWRDDGRCGHGYNLFDGRQAQCNPATEFACCLNTYCVYSGYGCGCPGCVDYTY